MESSQQSFESSQESSTTISRSNSISQESSVASLLPPTKDVRRKFEIDYVGTGSFQVSQLNLLHKRSIEIFKDSDAKLSARGLHHRSREVFVKEVQAATSLSVSIKRNEKRPSGGKQKPSVHLFQPHFQRALAFERLNKIDEAINDYAFCLLIDPKSSAVYFNRSGLHKTKGNYDAAIADMNTAIRLNPSNIEYRANRSLLYRECGMYMEAIKDTILERALIRQPGIAKNLEAGGDVHLEGDVMYANKLPEDPIFAALAVPPAERALEDLAPIIDFVKYTKFFNSFATNRDAIALISRNLELQHVRQSEIIFEEGQPGNHFYIILDGEVSITKTRKTSAEILETSVLVKFHRGQCFGEAALQNKGGLRTAGARANQPTKLLLMHADVYHIIVEEFKTALKAEVKLALLSTSMFQGWEIEKLDQLASYAIVRSYGANTEILAAESKVNHLMMIKSGIVKIVKAIPKPDVSDIKFTESKNGGIVNEELNEAPGLWVLDKNWKYSNDDSSLGIERVEFTTGILGSGQVFGELAVLDADAVSPVSAISSTAVELYCFESDDLLGLGARFVPNTMNHLKESSTLHDPHAEKISFYFKAKYNWELRKDKLMTRLKL